MRPFRVLVLTLASSLFLTSALPAQEHATDRGSYILGGSAGLSSQKNVGAERSTHMYFAPSVQYFVQPGLAIGGTLNLAHFRFDNQSITSYGAGPLLSYYFGAGEQSLRPYLSGRTIYSYARADVYGFLTYGGNVGVLYLLTRSVGLDASLFYNAVSYRGSSNRTDAFGLAVGFSAFAF